MSFRIVVLDFDGVVLESVHAKGRAFVTVFDRWPEHAEAVLAYHLAHGGTPRSAKIERIFRDVIGHNPARAELQAAVERFGALVVEAVLACPFVPGAREFIIAERARRRLFVVSATPTGELRSIVERLGLLDCFCGVHGTPGSKTAHLQAIIRAADVEAKDVLMVGDALEDAEAASAAGVAFVARRSPDGPSFDGRPGVLAVLDDLTGLPRILGPAGRR